MLTIMSVRDISRTNATTTTTTTPTTTVATTELVKLKRKRSSKPETDRLGLKVDLAWKPFLCCWGGKWEQQKKKNRTGNSPSGLSSFYTVKKSSFSSQLFLNWEISYVYWRLNNVYPSSIYDVKHILCFLCTKANVLSSQNHLTLSQRRDVNYRLEPKFHKL